MNEFFYLTDMETPLPLALPDITGWLKRLVCIAPRQQASETPHFRTASKVSSSSDEDEHVYIEYNTYGKQPVYYVQEEKQTSSKQKEQQESEPEAWDSDEVAPEKPKKDYSTKDNKVDDLAKRFRMLRGTGNEIVASSSTHPLRDTPMEDSMNFRERETLGETNRYSHTKVSLGNQRYSTKYTSVDPSHANSRYKSIDSVSPFGFYLNLDCPQDGEKNLKEWERSMSNAANMHESWTLDSAFNFFTHALQGNVANWWDNLPDSQKHPNHGASIASTLKGLVARISKEFLGIHPTLEAVNENSQIRKRLENLQKLNKLQICNICKYEDYYCEFAEYFYKLVKEDQVSYLPIFYSKLPQPFGMVFEQDYNKKYWKDNAFLEGTPPTTLSDFIKKLTFFS